MTYPHSTKAIVTSAPKEGRQLSWALQDVKLRDPKEDEVLVRIIATGICHTDLAISMTPPELTPYPRILGHEGAGVVISTGSSVKHVKKGDYVLMSIDFCGRSKCYNCSSGTPGFCTEFLSKNILGEESVYETEAGVKAGGMYFGQSSFAGMALVKEKSAINVTGLVRDEEELKMFAPFGCGFQTGAGAVTELAGVTEKDTVAVFGLGGVGMVAVMAAKLRGAHTIIGVDRVQSRLDVAKEIGATHVINTSDFKSLEEDLVRAVRTIAATGTNVNIETTGVNDIVKAGVQLLHPGGQMIIVGIVTGQTLNIDLGDLLSTGKSIRGCLEGNALPSKYVPQLIQWYRDGKLPIEKIIKHYQIDEFEKALIDMHTGSTIKATLIW